MTPYPSSCFNTPIPHLASIAKPESPVATLGAVYTGITHIGPYTPPMRPESLDANTPEDADMLEIPDDEGTPGNPEATPIGASSATPSGTPRPILGVIIATPSQHGTPLTDEAVKNVAQSFQNILSCKLPGIPK